MRGGQTARTDVHDQVVILHFLNDVLKHGSYTGFPTIGLETQTMENEHLREAFGSFEVPNVKSSWLSCCMPLWSATFRLQSGSHRASAVSIHISPTRFKDGASSYILRFRRVTFKLFPVRHEHMGFEKVGSRPNSFKRR